jgi:hypothetical protein
MKVARRISGWHVPFGLGPREAGHRQTPKSKENTCGETQTFLHHGKSPQVKGDQVETDQQRGFYAGTEASACDHSTPQHQQAITRLQMLQAINKMSRN